MTWRRFKIIENKQGGALTPSGILPLRVPAYGRTRSQMDVPDPDAGFPSENDHVDSTDEPNQAIEGLRTGPWIQQRLLHT